MRLNSQSGLFAALLICIISISACQKKDTFVESGDAFEEGMNFFDSGNYERAQKRLSDAIEKDPTNERALFARAYTNKFLGRYKESINDYTKCLKITPDDPESYWERADAYMLKGDYTECLKDTEKAIELNPDCYQAFFLKSKAELGLERYEDAAADLKQSLTINPAMTNTYLPNLLDKKMRERYQAYLFRASAYKAIGNNGQAHLDYQRARRLGYRTPEEIEAAKKKKEEKKKKKEGGEGPLDSTKKKGPLDSAPRKKAATSKKK